MRVHTGASDTLEEESISGREFWRFHTPSTFLVANIIVYIKIWILAHIKIQRFSSS